MSTTVDQRVVEMRFDNDRFEKNVATSMSTLAKLKQSLNLTGASKGLENINAAARNTSLPSLGSAAEAVGAKFSAMQVIGVTALANIANSAVNTGKQMLSALTIDPVKTGFNEYELKMDSIKTIVASTGEELDVVGKYLQELNEYSDQTIYSFADMTQNIGKFTNAGVKLEDAVMAIKGISNEAAVSGANANEASRAMYNFAQALSSGYVKLIDWKSIENANMATVEFKQELIDTALALGQVTDAGDGMYATLAGNTFNATKNFNEVFQDQWMTSEVLINTLKRYADESTDIGKKAKAAAQDVTKLTQVYDILKETAQSGWARTWELIFGDLNQAKAIFTPMTNFFSDIINGISDARNNLLEAAMKSPFGEIIEKINKVTSATKEVVDMTEKYAEVVNKVIAGEFGTGQNRWDKLAESGYNWAKVQNMVNEKLGNSVRHNEDLAESQKKVNEAQATTIEQLAKMSDAELKDFGFSDKEIKALRELQEAADRAGYSLKEVVNNPDLLSGRNLLMDGFKNLGKMIADVAKVAKKAWQSIFPPTPLEERAEGIYNLIAAFRKFTSGLTIYQNGSKTLSDTGYKLLRTFKGIAAAVDIVVTVLGGPLKWAFDAVIKLLGMFDIDILDITANIGDAIVALRNWIKEHNLFLKAIEWVTPYVKKAVDAIKEWVETFKETHGIGKDAMQGLLNGIVEGAKDIYNKIIEFANNVLEKIRTIWDEHSPSRKFFEIGKFAMEGLINGIVEGAKKVYNALKQVATNAIDFISSGVIGDTLRKVYDKISGFVVQVVDFIKTLDFGAIFAAAIGVGMLATVNKLVNVLELFAAPAEGLGEMLEGLGSMFEDIGASFKAAAFEKRTNGILNFAKAIGILALSVFLLASIEDTGKLWGAIGALGALAAIIAGLAALAAVMTKSHKGITSFKFAGIGMGILALAASLVVMAVALKKMADIKTDDINRVLLIYAALLVGMTLFLKAYGKSVKSFAAQKNIAKLGTMILLISAAMLIMTKVIKQAGELNKREITRGVIAITAVSLLFAALIAVSKFAGEHASKAGSMLFKMSLAMLVMIAVIKLAATVSQSEVSAAVETFVMVGLLFTAIVAVSKLAGQNASKAGGMLLLMSLSLILIVQVIKMIAKIPDADIKRGISVLAILELFFAGLIAVSYFAGEHAVKAGIMLMLASGALVLLTGVIFLLGKIATNDPKGMLAALGAITLICAIFAALIYVTKSIEKDAPVIGTLVVLIVAMSLLMGALAALTLIPEKELLNAAKSISLVLAAFAAMIGLTKFAKSTKQMRKTLGSMLMVTLGLAAIIAALSFFDTSNALTNAEALSLLMVSFAASLAIMSIAGKISTTVSKQMLPMLGIIAGLAVILGLMAYLKVEASIPTAIAIGLLANKFATALTILGYAGKISSSVSKQMLPMLGIIAGLAAILGIMAYLDVEASIPNAIALGLLLNEFAASFVILGAAGKISTTVSKNLPSMLLVTAGLAAILGIMAAFDVTASIPNAIALGIMLNEFAAAFVILGVAGKISTSVSSTLPSMLIVVAGLAAILGIMSYLNVEASIPTAIALGIMLNAMASAMLILGFIPKNSATAVPAMAMLTIVVAGLAVILGLLARYDVQPSIETALALSIMLLAMTGALAILALIGGSASAAIPAVASLIAVVAIIAAAIMAIGDLMMLIPESEYQNMMTGIDRFIAIFEKVAGGIGSVIGELVAGFMGADAIPALGTKLSEFMTNAQGFIDGAANLDPRVLEGTKALAGVILTLTAADLLAGLTSWLTGTGSFDSFGSQLPGLATHIKEFAANLGTFSEEQVKAVDFAAQAVVKLADAADKIPNEGGWAAKIFGENSIATFGSYLPDLGTNITSFVVALSGLSEENVKAAGYAADIIVKLADAAHEIPNEGGWAAKILGDNSIAHFGNMLPGLGNNLREFLLKIGSFTEEHVKSAGYAAEIVVKLAEAAQKIPNEGGWAAKILGDNSIAHFGANLPDLGTNIASFVTNLGEFSESQLGSVGYAAEAIVKLAEAAKQIPNDGGWVGKIFGENSISAFADQLPGLGTNLAAFVTNLGTFSKDQVNTVEAASNAIKAMSDASKGIDGQTEWAKKLFGDNSLGAFSENFAKVGDSLAKFVENLGTFTETQVNTVKSAVSAINAFAGLAKTDLKAAKSNMDGFGDKIVDMATDISDFIDDMPSSESVDGAVSKLKKLLDGIDKLVKADAETATKFVNGLEKMATDAISKFTKAFTDSEDDVKQLGKDLVNQVSVGASSKDVTDNLAAQCKLVASKGKDAVRSYRGSAEDRSGFYGAGIYLVDGFAAGITAQTWKAEAKAAAMASAALEAAEEVLDINSPSKEFGKVGKFSVAGFVNALVAGAKESFNAGSEMAGAAKDGLNSAIGKVLNVLDADMDMQPTIRPVLDLSGVNSGLNAIDGMFGDERSIGVMSNLRAISYAMNQNGQNGNSDVVSAIAKLGKQLGNIQGDTYHINGITYDDGSNITNAVEALVRAARVERRV